MKELWNGISEKLTRALGAYKYVLLIAAAGAILLLIPAREDAKLPEQLSPPADLFRVGTMEKKLEDVLSKVDGAGQVTVALTLRGGPRKLLAQNGMAAEGDHEVRRETELVLSAQGGGTQQPVTIQQLGPEYLGALIVTPGAEDPGVRLAISDAVSALTGLGADRISICKGK